ncbi:MAG: DNA polymerase IV [Kiritimatiellae bacterium]|nr:DNA polymerase IV [Kiritimatiellia bacterium]
METRPILHVDMDAFFASVEQRDRPELRGKPVIVGAGPHERGVVSTCSYEARRFGVHSAMPSREAYRLCPQGVFLYPDFERYHAASAAVFRIFERYTPLVEGVSCDEAFLDVSGAGLVFGDSVSIARSIRADIARELRLTASVGVAPNKFLAKLASDLDKPDGLTVVPDTPDEIARFLAPLSVGRIFGVGKKLGEALRLRGITTIGDVQKTRREHLAAWFGEAAAEALSELSFGRDPRRVETEREEKSISREHTFPEDESDAAAVERTLVELASDVARQVRAAGRWAATGKLKLRTDDFRTVTRQEKFPVPSRDDMTYRETALALFRKSMPRRPVRLVGFGVAGFTETPPDREGDLFGADPAAALAGRRDALFRAVDSVRSKFGASVSLGFGGDKG